jgi:cell wall-associated NlpC family hydrolase
VPSVSGLSRNQRIRARDRAVQAAELVYANKEDTNYTQDLTRRWVGIARDRRARRGQFPKHADCSSFVTWCLWNGLFLRFRLDDIVNGLDWRAGNTTSMLSHGRRVRNVDRVRRGDLVHYGSGATAHVAIVVGRRNGVPQVITWGSDDCPCFTRYNYRDDVREFRRYI